MQNLKYYIKYKNINDEDCQINIYSNEEVSEVIELVGGQEPFTITYPTDNFIYTPSKFSGATLRLVGGDYLMDLYSNNWKDHKINYLKNDIIEWTGYITPEVYSQDYNTELFEIELECVSGLATIEYFEFETSLSKISLFDVLKYCIQKTESDYKYIYIPNVYDHYLRDYYVSTSNFFDEDKKGMNLRDMIEGLCNFYNWTITEYNGNVYVVDYDQIIKPNGFNWIRYDMTFEQGTIMSMQDKKIIQDLGFKGSDNTLSIQNGYNKAVVIASDYTIESDELFPEIEYKDANKGLIINTLNAGSNKKATKIYYINDNENVSTYQYLYTPNSSKIWTQMSKPINNDNREITGAYPVRMSVFDKDSTTGISFDEALEIRLGRTKWYSSTTQTGDIATSEKGEFQVLNEGTLIDKYHLKIAEFKSDKSVYVTPEYEFVFNFDICYYDQWLEYRLADPKNKKDTLSNLDVLYETFRKGWYVPMIIKFIDDSGIKYYWDNEIKSWNVIPDNASEDSLKTKIYTNIGKGTHFTWDWMKAENTVPVTSGLNTEGTLLHVAGPMFGKFELTVYVPIQGQSDYKHTLVWMKNFKIKVIKKKSYTDIGDTEKTDTKYENVPNDKFISECDDISFILTSSNDSSLSLSKVFNNDGLINTNSWMGEAPVKPEERMINRITNQYDEPKIILSQNVKNNIYPYTILTDNYWGENKKFVSIGGEINTFMDSYQCSMINLK